MFSLASPRATRWLRSGLLLALAALPGAACSVINTDHCGNRDGNATCLQRDGNTPYCSICVADNNGCLAVDPGPVCLADTAPATGVDPTTTGDPTTGAPVTTTTGESPTTTTTPDPTTGTTTQTSEPADSSTTSDPTTGTTTTGAATTSDTDNTSTGDTTTGSTTGVDSESGEDSETSTGGPVCGNDEIEGDEVCDGSDHGGKQCWTLLPLKWGGGSLKCNNCTSFNDTDCCIGVGQKCDPLKPSEACCGGLKCKGAELLVNRCLN